ncbi:MAG: hypothetical protein ACMXYA_02280 [Candidatus Woesearchaeota archaeon]
MSEDEKSCCGGGCHSHNEGPKIEEIAYNNHFMINTLISLLIDEKIISKEKLEEKIQQVQEEQLKAYEELQKSEEKKDN